MELKRQVFEALLPPDRYDKPARRLEISATITEPITQALEKRGPPAAGLAALKGT